MITLEDLIIEMMPFSEGLKDWCKKHPEFSEALKIIYPERFVNLGGVVTTRHPNYSNDEIIGVYAFDYKREIFKQDFIVNKSNGEFILYTRNKKGKSGKYIKDINEFYSKYGVGGNYTNSHHLTFDQLPEEINSRALDAIRIATNLKRIGYKKPTQEQIDLAYEQLREVKKGTWFIKRKLNKIPPDENLTS